MQRQRMWVNTLHTNQYHANEGTVLTPIIIFFLVPHISTLAPVAPVAAVALLQLILGQPRVLDSGDAMSIVLGHLDTISTNF